MSFLSEPIVPKKPKNSETNDNEPNDDTGHGDMNLDSLAVVLENIDQCTEKPTGW